MLATPNAVLITVGQSDVMAMIKIVAPSKNDENGLEFFVAQPSNDIPRNKLVERLCRGLQVYIQ